MQQILPSQNNFPSLHLLSSSLGWNSRDVCCYGGLWGLVVCLVVLAQRSPCWFLLGNAARPISLSRLRGKSSWGGNPQTAIFFSLWCNSRGVYWRYWFLLGNAACPISLSRLRREILLLPFPGTHTPTQQEQLSTMRFFPAYLRPRKLSLLILKNPLEQLVSQFIWSFVITRTVPATYKV